VDERYRPGIDYNKQLLIQKDVKTPDYRNVSMLPDDPRRQRDIARRIMNLTNNDPVTETKNIPLRRLSKREIFNVNWVDEDGEVSSESDTEEESHMEVDPGISVDKVENLLEQWRKDWDGWAERCPK
jgi:hypothetical protein